MGRKVLAWTLALLVIPALSLSIEPTTSKGYGEFRTGPDVGESIPKFELSDQHGNPRNIDSLAGPNGLLLLFYRTADW